VSRGYGKIQWRLLAILATYERTASRHDRLGRGLDTPTLALRVHGWARRRGVQSRAQAYVFNVFGWLAEAARG
jgi:hypothetical protein